MRLSRRFKYETNSDKAITRREPSPPQLTVFGMREACVEGKVAILEYGSEVIRISNGKGSLRFVGSDLRLRCFNRGVAVVAGNILCIELSGGK